MFLSCLLCDPVAGNVTVTDQPMFGPGLEELGVLAPKGLGFLWCSVSSRTIGALNKSIPVLCMCEGAIKRGSRSSSSKELPDIHLGSCLLVNPACGVWSHLLFGIMFDLASGQLLQCRELLPQSWTTTTPVRAMADH